LKPYIIAVTGHRPKHLSSEEFAKAWDELGKYFAECKKKHTDLRVLVGGARGIDMVARDCCIILGIPYTICIPHVGYRKYWDEAGLGDDYDAILAIAPKVVFVVPETEPWHWSHNLKRNEYMVSWCDELVAVFKGGIPEDVIGKKGGGTRQCIECALKAKKPIHHIAPRS
jgi:hypothetical protein